MKRPGQKRVSAVLAVLCISVVYAAPYLTLHQMRVAIRQHDAAALSRHIDFPALKASLKTALTAGISGQPGSSSHDPFAQVGAMLADAAVDQYVDVLVTPQGVAYLMQGSSMARTFRMNVQNDLAASAAPPQLASDPDTAPPAAGGKMGYTGLNTFEVQLPAAAADDRTTTLIFRRSDLVAWKLAGIAVGPAAAPGS